LAGALIPEPWRVEEVRRETEDTMTLALAPVGGDGLAFAPGQFTMLYAFGSGEVPISISGDPAEPGRLIHTVRAVGAVTRTVCGLSEGDQLGVRGPFGSAWPVDEAAGGDLLIVAGGVGLAPLRPAIYRALARRGDFGRVIVLYGARSPDQLLFQDELEEWGRGDDLEVAVTVDTAGPEWRGRVGVVPALLDRAAPDPGRTTALLCGPEVMMRFTVAALAQAGLDERRIFLSMERNMRCAVGHCGHCQWGPSFVCRDGPVFSHEEIGARLRVAQL
jgi:NAD(P)H-flavin reductase